MMRAPLFSIVIPTYNRSELVQGAVRSVLGQTFADFEVVVSDNCSQDDTRDVVARFADHRGVIGGEGARCRMLWGRPFFLSVSATLARLSAA